MKALDDLKWIRIFTPIHIPKYLVEQIRDREFKVDDFYKYQEASCILHTNDGPKLNPLNHLWILVNEDNNTKGFCWFNINTLTKDIFINTFSVDKEYWYKGKAVEKLADFIKEIKKKGELNKVIWATNYPKHSLRHGFKKSKSILMEYTGEEDGKNNDGRDNTRREHRPVKSTTKTVSGEHNGSTRDRTTSGSSLRPSPTTV